MVRGRKPYYETDRDEYLEWGESHFGKNGRKDDLYLVRIAKYAGENLPHVHTAEELHVLALYVLQHLLPQIRHGMRA